SCPEPPNGAIRCLPARGSERKDVPVPALSLPDISLTRMCRQLCLLGRKLTHGECAGRWFIRRKALVRSDVNEDRSLGSDGRGWLHRRRHAGSRRSRWLLDG